MPEPGNYSSQDEWMEACVPTMIDEGRDQDQAAGKVRGANELVVASSEAERGALAQTERERFVAQTLSRLSSEATAQQRAEVEQLAGALYDEQQALQATQRS